MILVTGSAGFIGFHLAERLVRDGEQVIGLDVINDYYDVGLKCGRLAESGVARKDITYGELAQSTKHPNYRFIQLNLTDKDKLHALFAAEKFGTVVNLAAQAGVRYSLENPLAYIDSNIVGFTNVLEACRYHGVKHLVYASSSSVYGLNEKMPLSVHDNVDHPISFYAATKKSNELMAHTYSHLFGLATTGLRFFTVYGPWGRPDMAFFLFTEAILKRKPIQVFNHGKTVRDFTYIDDIVEGIVRVMHNPSTGNPKWSGNHPDPSTAPGPYQLYNIGSNNPIKLVDFIAAIEEELQLPAEKQFMEIQAGDVPATSADISSLVADLGYTPETSIKEGVGKFVAWYRKFYKQ
ncbi:NAD-dependent epimerase [Neolewinella litorea]|uniref:NAD-dependent epimerase n=1 Tax=Neolewinella litorea TaxID=2562452 RepID=A0A4S4NTE1_9BACT|nr:NAD-dependent epimerase [Neolewinella litorea]THH39510.1 NAD-dependent epimerase [Neolewinella litorea]